MKSPARLLIKTTLISSALIGTIASLIPSPSAQAATATWNGTTDALWFNDANWSAIPAPGPGDTATFDGAGNGNVILDLGAGVTVANIAFDTAAVASYTLGTGAPDSQSLTLANGGSISLTAAVTANQLVHAALTLGTDGTTQTFTLANASPTHSLTLAGGIAGSAGSGLKTLSIGGSGTTVLSGVISNGAGGTVAITKTGNGTLTLAHTGNTFSGGVTIGANTGTTTALTNTGTNVSGLGAGAVSIGAGSTLNLLSINTATPAPTTINNTFTGSGLLKLTFTDPLPTNTFLNGLAGFAGNIQLSNSGVNADKLNTNNNMGSIAGSLTIDNGSQLFVTGNSTTIFNGGISFIGTGNSENRGVIRLGAGVLGGNISMGGNSTIGLEGGYLTGNISAGVAGTQTLTFGGTAVGNGTLSGVIADGSGQVALTKNGTGTLWLTGTNTYTGATTITGGRLQLGLSGTTGSLSPSSAITVTAGTLTFNRSNAMADGVDFGTITGAGNVAQNGTGATTFGTGTPHAYTGQTQVNRGTLTLDFANLATPTDMINAGSALNLGGGALSLLGKNSGTTSQTFNGTTLSPGRSTIAPNRNGGTSTTLTLGALTNNAGSTIFFTPATAWAAGGTGTPGAPSTTEIVTIAGATRNGTAITMPGAGGFVFIGANVFHGTGAAARYAVALGAAAAPYQLAAMPGSVVLPAAGGSFPTTVHQIQNGTTLTATATSYALIGNSSAGATLATATFPYTANGYLGIQTGAITISGTGGVTIGSERDFVVNNANTGNLTISAVIANNAGGASSVTNSSTGTGIFTMSGTNTYTGGTYFNGGTTSIAADANLGTAPAAATPGHLTFNGGTLRVVPTLAVTLNANRGIALGAGGGTIVNNAAFAVTVNAIIAGVGGLTLSNASTSTLAIGGANTYTGGTIISGTGQIVPTVNAAFGVGGILTLNGGQMRATTTANITLANPVNIAADTTFPTATTEKSLIFTGPATLNGTRTLTSGVGATVAGTTVQFSNGITESTPLSGLNKAGTGNLTLGGLNTFTGPTAINAGRLSYTKRFALYAANPASWTDTNLTIASGATMMLNVGGLNEFTAADVAAISALGTATGGFQAGSNLGLDTANGSITVNSGLANANAINLLKIGANNLTLNGTNTYAGTTTIQGGTLFANGPSATSQININGGTNTTLQVTNPAAAGTGSINIATGVTTPSLLFRLDGGGNISLPNSLIGNSGITTNIDVNNNGTGTNGVVQLNGTPTTGLGNVTFNITGGNGYSLHIASIFSSGGANGNTIINPTTANVTFGNISSITNTFAYNWQLDGTTTGNAVTGAMTNGSGTIAVTKTNTSTWTLAGNNSYTGATTVNAGTLILSGTNTGPGATNIVGGTLLAGANGALNPNSAVTMTDAAAAVLDLNGYTGTIASLSGGGATGGNVSLGNGTLTTGDTTSTSFSGNITGTGNLVKVGVGTFTLAGAQSYTGTTSVNGGVLQVDNMFASSAVNVAGSTLGGIGTLSGIATINAGGMLSPATATTAGTITLASLTLNAGSGIAYEFGGTNDLVAITAANGLTLNGGALSLYATGGIAPLTANGTYTLFSYLTGFGGTLTNLSVANAQAGKTYSVADAGGTITLTIGTATSSDWSGGAADGLWTTAGNWTGGTPNSVGAVATFGTTPGSPTTVAVNGAKTVGSIIFDNTNAYTVTGGAADALTFDNGIASGAISVLNGSHTISAPIVLNGPANITPGTATTITLTGVISGAKTVSYSGTGAAIVSGANTYSAGTNLISGTLTLANGTALGTGTFTITGGTIDAASALTLTANNAQVWNGDFTFAGTNNLNLGTGPVTSPLPRTITTAANTLTVGGSISGTSLTKAGTGTLALSANNTFTGSLTVDAGTLSMDGDNTFTTATVNGGDLTMSGSNTFTTATINGGTLTMTGDNNFTAATVTAGTLTMSGNNTFAGALNITGTAILSGDNSARPTGTSNLTVVNSGGTLQLQANPGNTTAGTSTALSAERTANQPFRLSSGGTLQLRSDSAVTFAGANNFSGMGSATVSIDVGQLTPAGMNHTLTIAPGGFNVNNSIINVSGANGYTLHLPAITSATANTSTYNGNTAPLTIGTYTASVTGNHILGLGGSNTANLVAGIISNGSATTLGITKTGTGTWDVQGANTNTGPIVVSEGTLKLTGAKTGNSGIITVGNQPGLNATLEITNGTYTIGGAATRINVGSQPTTPATATVNQTGGALVFTLPAGDQVLIGQVAGIGNTGIYNLSAGSITTSPATNRGIILGTNTAATGIFNLSGTGVINMTAASGGGGDAILQIGRSDAAADNTTSHFNQTGGTANIGILAIGGNGATSINLDSTLTITGGTFTANSFTRLAQGNNNIAVINIGGTADVTLPAFPTARGTGSTATVNFDGGTLRSLAASTTYMGSLSNAFIKTGGAKFEIANNITVAQPLLAHPLSTGGGLTKTGTGTLTLNGANTYTGKTVVIGGGLTFNSIGNIGDASSALGAPTTVAEGTIDLAGTAAGGTLTYTGPTASTDRIINLTNAAIGATINNSGSGLLTLNGDITGGASILTFRGNGNITMTGLIPATHTGPVSHTETSTLTLTNAANAFPGPLRVLKGVISFDTIDNKNVPSAIGAGTVISLGQDGFINTGTLQYTGLFGGSSDRDIEINSFAANGNGGIIENTIPGQLFTLSGDISVLGSGTLPTLGLTGAGNGALSGDILGTPPLAVTKTGTGTWTLSGANTHTGATNVNAGTLFVTGSISASAVTVNNTGTLAGTGTIGTLTTTFGGTIAPGASIGTLSSSSATFGSNSTFALEINTTFNTTDLLSINGNLTLAATHDTILNITDLGASVYDGTPLPFITYTGTWDGNLFNHLGAPIADGDTITVGTNTFTLDYDYAGNSVALIPEPGTAALLLGGLAMLSFRRRRRE